MRPCLQCGCELPANAPKDLCPKCLMGAALGFSPSSGRSSGKGNGTNAVESPEKVGPYKILQKLGEGGCGMVYLAEQEQPFRRRVALKLIKLGMDTKQVIARFEAERQALALMHHPNVAKVLDAGASETGRPYFVMELVRGSKITEYCDKYCLSTSERLELFLQVCRAIQHAHQKGIIHRDIKPSNILVTQQDGKAVPMVIDFGIAKATGGQVLTNRTIFTAVEQVIGTPAYMSPEQAERRWDIDTRTDIYSLGVLLYELLTGKTPFDTNESLRGGWDVLRRKICETEPQTPSTRLTALAPMELNRIAKCRRAEGLKLIHVVRGDLDWIVMKCLEKETARRYETCNGIASDIERHLNKEPVIARPASNAYRFRKMVSRNRLVVGAVVAVMAALLVGTATSTWFLLEERKAKREAEELKDKAKASERAALIREAEAIAAKEKAVAAEKIAREKYEFFDDTQIHRIRPAPNGPFIRPQNSTNFQEAANAKGSKFPSETSDGFRYSENLPSFAPAYTPPNFGNGVNGPQDQTNLVFSPKTPQGRQIYESLTKDWWRWLLELPWVDQQTGMPHPANDAEPFDISFNQERKNRVWFLASPFGSVVREGVIPPDVYLFIGLLNVECSDIEAPPFAAYTELDRVRAAASLADHIVDLHIEVNGKVIEDRSAFRIPTRDITFHAPSPWLYGELGGEGRSSGDGYFLMLNPLPPGDHTVYYRGAFSFKEDGPFAAIAGYHVIEMIYRLTVPF